MEYATDGLVYNSHNHYGHDHYGVLRNIAITFAITW